MTDDAGALRLASSEDEWTRSDWEKAAATVLRKGRRLAEDAPDSDVWTKLSRTTYDGIVVAPLGTPDQLDHVVTHGRPTREGAWDVRTRMFGDNAAALADLESGVTSLWLLAEHIGTDLAAALEGVRLDLAPVVLESPTLEHAESLVALGPLHPDGNLGATDDADLVPFARLALHAGVRAAVVDATTVHDRGASDGQELGWVLARGAGDAARPRGCRHPARARRPAWSSSGYAATDEQFPTIAKLRAARRLWARVPRAVRRAGPATAQRQHAVTSRPMMSAYDPWVNMLRTTVAAFARRRRRRRRGHRAALRQPARRARRLRPPDRPQHLEPADPRVPRRARGRPGRRRLRRREADRRPGPRGLGPSFGRIEDQGADRRTAARASRASTARRRGRRSPAARPHHRAQRVPEPRRDAARAARRPRPRTRCAATAPRSRRCATTRRPPTSSWPPWARSRRTPPARPSPPTCSPPAASPSTWPAPPTGVDDLVAAYAGQAVVCLAGTDAAYAEWGAEAAAALRDRGRDAA